MMPTTHDRTFVFESGGASLVGIVSLPADRPVARRGVLVVVGGPQYRVGSHRQFVLLARALAARGVATMRFDCAGMGDSDGEPRAFTDRGDELRAALGAFVREVPAIAEIVVWGLCDAASAALLDAVDDARVTGLVLLNPWVRSDAGLARTHLRHYYGARLLDRAFWARLLRGRVGVVRSLRDFTRTLVAARTAGHADESLTYQQRMARGWSRFRGDILLVCSGEDLTAREFLDHAASDPAWKGLVDGPRVARLAFADADHTFSCAAWRDRVATATADWVLGRAATEDRVATREAA